MFPDEAAAALSIHGHAKEGIAFLIILATSQEPSLHRFVPIRNSSFEGNLFILGRPKVPCASPVPPSSENIGRVHALSGPFHGELRQKARETSSEQERQERERRLIARGGLSPLCPPERKRPPNALAENHHGAK